MGRRSPLTDAQWKKIHSRILKGEAASDLAREYGVSRSAISMRFSERTKRVKAAAVAVIEAENVFHKLNFAEQRQAKNLIAELQAIGHHMASAGRLNAATAHRLAGIANAQVSKIDDVNPMESQEVLQGISALTKMSNDASVIGLSLLNANKNAMDKASDDADPVAPVAVTIERKNARRASAVAK